MRVPLVADLTWVADRATALLHEHLPAGWTFRFDNAKTRAGLCNYRDRIISVSKPLARLHSASEVEQTILHEVAHALAGHAAGHGAAWLQQARAIGYQGARTHHGEIDTNNARYKGVCPAGHEVYRFRRPTKAMSCARCGRGFDPRYQFTWYERVR